LGTLTIRSGVALAEGIHRYPEAVIAVESLTPKTAARRFRRGIVATKGVIAGGLAISPVGGDTGGVRLTSDQAYGTSGPGWPRIWVGLNPNDMFEPDPRAVLHAKDQPFYPSLQHARAERLYGVKPVELLRLRPPSVVVVLTDRRARLGLIEVDEEGLLVSVERGNGALRPGYRLRAVWRDHMRASRVERFDASWDGAGQLRIPCLDVPAELTIALVDPEQQVIDQRSWNDTDLLAGAPESLAELASRLLIEGEGARVEYKRELTEKSVRRSFAETVAAFSNAEGGVILVGVGDDAVVLGYDAPKVHDQITDLVRQQVLEAVDVAVDRIEIDGLPVVVVRVPPGDPELKPYRAADRVMIRAGATTRVATTVEHRRLCTQPVVAENAPFRW
jgi:hypothetical protein